MNIQINENFRITSDNYNVTVEQKKIAGENSAIPGEVKWAAISFHRNIKQAALWLLERDSRSSDCTTLEDLCKSFQKSCEQITNAIERTLIEHEQN